MSEATADGMYSYRWPTRFGVHRIFFKVVGGIIQSNPATITNPVKDYEGRQLDEFTMARLDSSWKFFGVDSMRCIIPNTEENA